MNGTPLRVSKQVWERVQKRVRPFEVGLDSALERVASDSVKERIWNGVYAPELFQLWEWAREIAREKLDERQY